MICINGITITMTVGTAKEMMRKLTASNLIDHDDAMFSLKMAERGNAEFIAPFPNCLDVIEPTDSNVGKSMSEPANIFELDVPGKD